MFLHNFCSVARLLSFFMLGSTLRNISRFRYCKMAYSTAEYGSLYSSDYRMFFKNASGIISPFHDIPLMADEKNGIFNMIVEIPKWSNAKMEMVLFDQESNKNVICKTQNICTKSKMNPIKQDMKKGKVRFVKNVFPYKGYIWNYGAIPQTWEDPEEVDTHTDQKGDADPIDVIEIGNKVANRGDIVQIKLLGVLAMIDDGETDWKVIAINVNDPLAKTLNDIDDVDKTMPGLLEATTEWFKIYKMPGGNLPNKFAFNGIPMDKQFATDIVMHTHKQWKDLMSRQNTTLSSDNVSVDGSVYRVNQTTADGATTGLPDHTAPSQLPDDHDVVYYLTDKQKHS